MKNLLKTPKVQMASALFLIFLSSLFEFKSFQAIVAFAVILLSTLISDFIFLKIRGIKLFFPSAAIVSGTIITLLSLPALPLYIPISIGILAMFSKNFIRIENRHIFNPAGFGLLSGSLIFSQTISWWAVSWQGKLLISFAILLLPGIISLIRLKRFQIFSFLIFYAFLNFFLLRQPLNGTFIDPMLIFYSLVMLPEPMTTPNNHFRQITFGIFVAVFAFLISSPFIVAKLHLVSVLDPLIFSLLLGNLIFFKFK